MKQIFYRFHIFDSGEEILCVTSFSYDETVTQLLMSGIVMDCVIVEELLA